MLAGVALPKPALSRAEPLLLAGVLACAYLILHPPSADLAAQVFRTELFERQGFAVWNGQWYGGHHTLGYSVLFPPLGALLGVRLVGALAAVTATVAFERLTRQHFGPQARVGAIWFGAASATNLFTGRLTFALGVAIGLGALLALQRGRTKLAFALAVLCPLGSPVAGLFLALAGLAQAIAQRDRRSLAMACAALGTTAAMALAFPEAGFQPFVVSTFWPILAFAALVLALVPTEQRALRIGAVLYALAAVATFALSTPMGGNAARLGTLFGGPLLACVLSRRRPLVLAALALPLLYWQWFPPVRDVAVASGDPAVKASYYAPLNRFLALHGGANDRIEIPFTRNHWESVYVGLRFALARGWERQLDTKYDGLFYRPTLSPRRYRRWLEREGVGYVALPDAPLDYAAKTEAQLIERGVAYLKPVWSSAHWRVFRFTSPSPLVIGPARLERLSSDWFSLRAHAAGDVIVRVRYTPYWKLAEGIGCVERGPGGLTRLRLAGAGPVRVVADFAPSRLLSRGPRCRLAG